MNVNGIAKAIDTIQGELRACLNKVEELQAVLKELQNTPTSAPIEKEIDWSNVSLVEPTEEHATVINNLVTGEEITTKELVQEAEPEPEDDRRYNKIVFVGRGRATHIAKELVNGLGKRETVTACGSGVTPMRGYKTRNSGLPYTRENITCQKCIKVYEMEYSHEPK